MSADGPTPSERLPTVLVVTRGKRLRGGETLHWSFVGCVRDLRVSDCEHCGQAVDEQTDFCPHCGGELSDTPPEGNDD